MISPAVLRVGGDSHFQSLSSLQIKWFLHQLDARDGARELNSSLTTFFQYHVSGGGLDLYLVLLHFNCLNILGFFPCNLDTASFHILVKSHSSHFLI